MGEPQARRLVAAATTARVPLAMGSLVVLLGVQAHYSYGVAGLAAGAYALGMGVGSPPRARLADRLGSQPVLNGYFVGATAAFLG